MGVTIFATPNCDLYNAAGLAAIQIMFEKWK